MTFDLHLWLPVHAVSVRHFIGTQSETWKKRQRLFQYTSLHKLTQELKKKAETKIAQIKKQLLDDKETAVGELNGNNNALQNEVEELKTQIHNLSKVSWEVLANI